MEALSMLFSGFADVLQPANILFLFGGVAVGLVLLSVMLPLVGVLSTIG